MGFKATEEVVFGISWVRANNVDSVAWCGLLDLSIKNMGVKGGYKWNHTFSSRTLRTLTACHLTLIIPLLLN